MFLKKWWDHHNLYTRVRQARALYDIHSVGEFRTVLERERARANRNGHEFSLVTFDVGNPDADDTQVRCLVHVLTHRVRSTDEIGWLTKQCIGILLPYTPPDGAWKMAEDVSRIIAVMTSSPMCTVYTYPYQWLPSRHSHTQQRQFADPST